jgi:peptide deformylase
MTYWYNFFGVKNMTIRKLVTFPNDVLSRKAEIVEKFDKELQVLVEDMIETMRDAPGVGLAAPQIGISRQVAVIEFGDEEDDSIPKQLYVLVNPEIIKQSDSKVNGIEGCLSVPGLAGNVARSKVVTVSGFNQYGEKVKIRAQGWLARIFQHEIDHLNGKLYLNRTDQIWQPESDDMDSI